VISTARFERADVIDWYAAFAMLHGGALSLDLRSFSTLPVLTHIKLDGLPKPRDWTDCVEFWCDRVRTMSDAITARCADTSRKPLRDPPFDRRLTTEA
jgi:hypothetical protein